MSVESNSIVGANSTGALSFEFAYSTATTKAIVRGGYSVYATTDCYLKLDLTANLTDAAALPSTQPAVTAANHTIRLFAGVPVPFDVPGPSMSVSVIQASSGGTITFNGPFRTAKV